MMVVLYHYTFRGVTADNMSIMPYPLLADIAKYGYLGVDLFFMISGFVILMTASSGSPKKFVISRVVRLYPAFWVCCTTTFLVILLLGNGRYKATFFEYLANMTMFSGFIGVPSIDGAYWSLFVEMKFYLLVFLVLILGFIKYSEIILGGWLFTSLVLANWHIPYISFFLIPDYSHYFIIGAMFYIIHCEGINFYRLFIIGSGFLLAVWKATNISERMALNFGTYFNTVIITVILLVFLVMFYMISIKRFKWLITPKWLFLGALTYPLYLIHQNFGFMIFNASYPSLNKHILMWSTVTGVLLFAFFVNRFIEQRYSPQLKQLFERRSKEIVSFNTNEAQ